jgi:hypothetical protein
MWEGSSAGASVITPTADESALATAPKYRNAPRFRVPAPQISAHVDDAEDPEMAAYNRYLLSLHEKDLEKGLQKDLEKHRTGGAA